MVNFDPVVLESFGFIYGMEDVVFLVPLEEMGSIMEKEQPFQPLELF